MGNGMGDLQGKGRGSFREVVRESVAKEPQITKVAPYGDLGKRVPGGRTSWVFR